MAAIKSEMNGEIDLTINLNYKEISKHFAAYSQSSAAVLANKHIIYTIRATVFVQKCSRLGEK